MWLHGRVLAKHAPGPEFNPQDSRSMKVRSKGKVLPSKLEIGMQIQRITTFWSRNLEVEISVATSARIGKFEL